MKTNIKIAISAGALLLVYHIGVNQGYGMGADDAQCVTYHLLSSGDSSLVSEKTADVACAPSNARSEWLPAYMLRRLHVQMFDRPRVEAEKGTDNE